MIDTVCLSEENIELFCGELVRRERSPGTVEQYRRSLMHLCRSLGEDKRLEREMLLSWKQKLTAQKAVQTVNCMIAAVNAYLDFAGAAQLKLKSLKCQRKIFSENELTEQEFQALVAQARREKDDQTAVLLTAMSGSGVRVSEVRFLTVEAAKARMAVIRLKGKTRQIPLGNKLCGELLAFAKKKRITSGPIFVSKRGIPLDRRRIWERMKRLCVGAGVEPEKVHPHALRHLFARLFYGITRDIAKLADLLGHGSIETTRIYIMTSDAEHRTILDRLAGYLSAKKAPPLRGAQQCRT